MTLGVLFFALCSLVALGGALLTVLARSPIRSAVGLLGTIFGIAGLFLKLNAEFMAAIQLIVYAGAVVVLFVFVIMLLGPDAGANAEPTPTARVARWLSGGLMGLMGVWWLRTLFNGEVGLTPFPELPEGYGSVEAVGRRLFMDAIVPFELATALLIVAVVGAIAVARSQLKKRILSRDPNPSRRFFHGPLHPRDAERPLPKGQTT